MGVPAQPVERMAYEYQVEHQIPTLPARNRVPEKELNPGAEMLPEQTQQVSETASELMLNF
jgi:hypothetical protein